MLQWEGFMSDNFTDRVRKVLVLAREEAIRFQRDQIGTEHLLLGILREGEGVAAAVLTTLGLDRDQLHDRIEVVAKRGTATVLDVLPYTSRARSALESAATEARTMDHSYVGTEHLLLGLLHEEDGVAARVLHEFGVAVEEARIQTRRFLSWEPGQEPVEDVGWPQAITPETLGIPLRSPFTVSIDDRSPVPIPEQIAAQVREAVATGRLSPGDHLPTVRRLADALDVAPGTVARAYDELKRTGVVAMDGTWTIWIVGRPSTPLPEAQRADVLIELFHPVVATAFQLGATADEVRVALEQAVWEIFPEGEEPVRG
jgi:DNA-binding transcriptional regulator YhcF (GntR family)